MGEEEVVICSGEVIQNKFSAKEIFGVKGKLINMNQGPGNNGRIIATSIVEYSIAATNPNVPSISRNECKSAHRITKLSDPIARRKAISKSYRSVQQRIKLIPNSLNSSTLTKKMVNGLPVKTK